MRFVELLLLVFPSVSDLLDAVDDAGGGKNVDDDDVDRAATLDATPTRSVDSCREKQTIFYFNLLLF